MIGLGSDKNNWYSNILAAIVEELVFQLVLAHKMVPSIKYRLGQCQRRSGSVDLQKMWKQRKPWNISSHNWQRFKNSNLHSHSILFLVFYCLSRAWEEKTTICINPILSKERKNIKEKNTTSFLYTPRLGHACRNSFRNLLWVSSTI